MVQNRFESMAATVPGWLAWPLSAASTLFAIGGGVLVMLAAAFGSLVAIVWAAIAFLLAGVLWYAADFTQLNRDTSQL